MNEACLAFLDKVSGLSPLVLARHRKTLEYWAPDSPPITIIFGETGSEIASNLESFDQQTKQAIFSLIERGMSSSDEQLRAAVATGLVEAMIAESSKRKGGWEEIRPLLGDLSRAHADWWMSEE